MTRREGASYDDNTGALLVTLGSGGTIPNPIFTGTGGSGVPFVLAQSFAAVSGAADTNENVLATITVPAGAMGANGMLRLLVMFAVTNNGNAKTLRVRYSGAAGTEYMNLNIAGQAGTTSFLVIANRGATNSQVGTYNPNAYGGWGHGTRITSAVDTTAATTIVISVQKASAGDTMTLDGYLAELIKP